MDLVVEVRTAPPNEELQLPALRNSSGGVAGIIAQTQSSLRLDNHRRSRTPANGTTRR
jgi:hypothetical protein